RLDLGGTDNNLTGTATGRVQGLTVDRFPLGQATASVGFSGTSVRIENGVLTAPAGRALVQGSFDTAARTLSFTVDAPALSLAAPPFRDLARGVGGELSLEATLDGTFDHPQAMVSARGQGVELADRMLGEGGRAELLATWDGESVRAAGSLLGLVTFDGGGRLDSRGAQVAFDVRSDNLPGIVRLAAQRPLPTFTGSFSGQATATADFATKRYQARLTLPDLRADFEGRQVRNTEPVVVNLDPERLELRSFDLSEKEHQTDFSLNGTVGLTGELPLNLHLESTLWAGWSKLFLPDVDIDGFVEVLVVVRGTLKDPAANGQAVLRDARMVVPGLPSALEEISGQALFNRDQVIVDNLSATFAGGKLRATGTFNLPEAGKPFVYNAQLSARGVSIRYPEGFVNHGNADLTLIPSEGGGRLLRGTVDLDRIYYLEDVPVATLDIVKRLFQRSRLEAAPTNGFLASTQVSIAVSGPGALRVHNNVADLHGDVNLTLRGSLARPVVLGSVQIDPGGKLIYTDNEYRVERGQITFDNAYKIDPVIDVLVRTRVRDFDITVSFSGTLDRLSTNFSSNANLADLEIIALLATGQELSEADRLRALATPPGQVTQTNQQNVSASSILAGQAASAIGQRVGTLFGFDRVRINPIAVETGQSVGGVGFTVGKRLSRDVFVTYSTDPTVSRQNVLQVEWRIAGNVTLLLTQTSGSVDKSYAVDARWEKRF
ncbi:MAG TPA: translocation/assembly module TamB domain-containing protein, partial [Thermoanaerobaculia bacterium]|nr:translocation/assembly module TamB domain-containing protein [Thermoanaerobaculia bacterium]